MSRIGRKPVDLPAKVEVSVKDDEMVVKGPLGSLQTRMPKGVSIEVKDGQALVGPPPPTRANRGYQGLTRALLANMVEGVTKGYTRTLTINGVGYKAELSGEVLTCTLGFSHTKSITLPKGITAEVPKQGTSVTISGIDKQLVGQVAAQIRGFKIPEPYKAKGVKYADETIRRKVGKAGVK